MKSLVVCLDMGTFDIPMFESTFDIASRQYYKKLRKLTSRAKIKEKRKVRELRANFKTEDFLLDLRVKKV
ncbi:hypothetical protein ACKUB1_13645 [Methanospirillum stamsii]|uniref:Uncharacterized protein n=1 Tax=Methanospirillum stamsii TaxID=1277351 RepID=A0A2V2N855_9EURY|nr:hypothetical protein [Methanospirillum stamsii]PWR74850.1 hypothetical protein DLD82_08100 [Methanospirillum stamsii]